MPRPKFKPWTGLFLFIISALVIIPFFWVILSSFRSNREIFANPLMLPERFLWSNYYQAWSVGNFGRNFVNSMLVSVLTVVGSLIISCPAGYAFAHIQFKGRDLIFYLLIGSLAIPTSSSIIALFVILKQLHLIDSLGALIIPYISAGFAFNCFLMRNFFKDLSKELIEVAKIDGCSEMGVFRKVMLPLAQPALLTVALFTFSNSWNDYFLPQIVLYSPEKRTLPVALVVFSQQNSTNYSLLFAGSVIAFIPIVLFYLIFQRQYIEGMAAGSLKG